MKGCLHLVGGGAGVRLCGYLDILHLRCLGTRDDFQGLQVFSPLPDSCLLTCLCYHADKQISMQPLQVWVKDLFLLQICFGDFITTFLLVSKLKTNSARNPPGLSQPQSIRKTFWPLWVSSIYTLLVQGTWKLEESQLLINILEL